MKNCTTSQSPRKDVYQIVTDRILELLDKGTVPWRKPWQGGAVCQPKNLVSKKPYRGINIFLLGITATSTGYRSPYWLTYKQATDLGGHVRKGEKSTLVVFWKINQKIETDNETGDKKIVNYPVLRYYNVFNLDQCDDVNPDKIPEDARIDEDDLLDFEPLAACDNIVEHYSDRPIIEHDREPRAYYRPSADKVHMPDKELFNSIPEYYSTLFHELTHSTGHETRLNRDGITEMAAFGSALYSKEELTAEMGAAMLCGMAGIDNQTIDNSAAYIDGWRSKIKGDKKLVVNAAARAQKAVDYILGENQEGGDS